MKNGVIIGRQQHTANRRYKIQSLREKTRMMTSKSSDAFEKKTTES